MVSSPSSTVAWSINADVTHDGVCVKNVEGDDEEEETMRLMTTGKEDGAHLVDPSMKEFVPPPHRTAVLMALCVLAAAENFSAYLPASFFPTDAMDRGVSQERVGVVLASVSVMCLVMTPLVGWLLEDRRKRRETRLIVLGVTIECVAYALFALLDFVQLRAAVSNATVARCQVCVFLFHACCPANCASFSIPATQFCSFSARWRAMPLLE